MYSRKYQIESLQLEIAEKEKSLDRLKEKLAELIKVSPDPLEQFLERLRTETYEWWCGPDHSGDFNEHFGKLIMEFVLDDRSRIAQRLNTPQPGDAWDYVNPATRGAIMAMIEAGGR
jgi:hypothetical protein